MDAPEDQDGLPRELRFLKTLVTVLTVAMIGGVITITVLLVIRLNATQATVRIAPGDFVLPAEVGVVGISVIDGRTVIVGDDAMIRVYDSESRALLQEVPAAP